jgi:hypothetical protein
MTALDSQSSELDVIWTDAGIEPLSTGQMLVTARSRGLGIGAGPRCARKRVLVPP